MKQRCPLVRYERRSPVNFLPLDICVPEPVQRNSHSNHHSNSNSSSTPRQKICTMHVASHCAVMFFWTAVCVRPQDPPSVTPPPCFIPMGDVPYTKCVVGVYPGRDDASTEKDTIPMSSRAVTESVPTAVFTSAINPTSTTPPKPATITPTDHPSPNSPEETKFPTITPTHKPMTEGETVHKNHSDEQSTSEPTTCACVRTSVNTELLGLMAVYAVLMVITGTLSFCLYKQCKKRPSENPVVTRLISIPNPAFSNP